MADALLYSDLLDIMQQRAERLGLVVPGTGLSDTAELEIYLYQALFDIIETNDLPTYTMYDQLLATTTPNLQHYPLPDTFGRLLLPRVQNKRGIFLFDGTANSNLEYVEPQSFTSRVLGIAGIPRQFTVMGRDLFLFPIPASALLIKGTYIRSVERPDLDSPVLLAYPTALIEQALFRLASDSGKQVQNLSATRQEAFARLVAGSR